MAAAPQEWIDSSFALLERLERERDGLASALAELDGRLSELHVGVDQTGIELGDMHVERQRIEEARRSLAKQADELDSAQTRLWDRLVALQNEREAIKAAEAELLDQITSLEAREESLPVRYHYAQTSMAQLETELASATQTRTDIARELASLDKEMAQMIRALESVAGGPDDFDDGETNVAPSPLRLVGGGPPPIPGSTGRAKLPKTEMIPGSGARTQKPAAAATMPFVPTSPTRTVVPPSAASAASAASGPSGRTVPASELAPTTRHNVVPLRDNPAPAYASATVPAAAPAPMMGFAQAAPMYSPPQHVAHTQMAHAQMAQPQMAPGFPPAAVPSYIPLDGSDDLSDARQAKKARRTRRRLWLGIMAASAAVVAMGIQVAPQTPWWSDIEPSMLRARNAMLAMVDSTPAAGLVPASWRGSAAQETVTALVPTSEEAPMVKSASVGPPPTPAPVAPEQNPVDPLAQAAAEAEAEAAPPVEPAAGGEPSAAAPPEEPAPIEDAAAPEEPEEVAKPAPSRSKSSSRRKKKSSSRARKASSSSRPAPKPAAAEPSSSPTPKKRKNGVSVTSSDDPLSGL